MTFLLTSNGKLYWQDFTPEQFSKNGKEVTSDMFEENPNILALAENSDFFNIIEKQSQKKFSISNSADVMMSHLISNLGGILKGEKAIQLNKKSIEINPNDPELYNNLASSYDSLKRYEDALEAIKEGIKVDRNYVHFYENLAKVFRKLGRDEDVVKALEEGQKRDPNNSYWSKSLAPAYEKLGRYEDARTARIDAFIIDTFINESTD
jgi:tetratricopeptide (TPR) repeat protein